MSRATPALRLIPPHAPVHARKRQHRIVPGSQRVAVFCAPSRKEFGLGRAPLSAWTQSPPALVAGSVSGPEPTSFGPKIESGTSSTMLHTSLSAKNRRR